MKKIILWYILIWLVASGTWILLSPAITESMFPTIHDIGIVIAVAKFGLKTIFIVAAVVLIFHLLIRNRKKRSLEGASSQAAGFFNY
jgi:hypothetical protein